MKLIPYGEIPYRENLVGGLSLTTLQKKSLRIYLVGRWKSRNIENGRRMEKWEDKKDFNFAHFYLVQSKKVEG